MVFFSAESSCGETSGIFGCGYQTTVYFFSILARVSGGGWKAASGPKTTRAIIDRWMMVEIAKDETRRVCMASLKIDGDRVRYASFVGSRDRHGYKLVNRRR